MRAAVREDVTAVKREMSAVSKDVTAVKREMPAVSKDVTATNEETSAVCKAEPAVRRSIYKVVAPFQVGCSVGVFLASKPLLSEG